MLQAVACGPLLSALVSLMADPMEKVRELDFILLRRLLEAIPDPEALLPAIMPAMHKRFGALPVEETSEELRREIADLLSNVLSKLAAPALIQNYKVRPHCAMRDEITGAFPVRARCASDTRGLRDAPGASLAPSALTHQLRSLGARRRKLLPSSCAAWKTTSTK